jgi:hypothetical protein
MPPHGLAALLPSAPLPPWGRGALVRELSGAKLGACLAHLPLADQVALLQGLPPTGRARHAALDAAFGPAPGGAGGAGGGPFAQQRHAAESALALADALAGARRTRLSSLLAPLAFFAPRSLLALLVRALA